MKNDRLYDVVDRWAEMSWVNRKRICWLRFKSIYKVDNKLIGSLITLVAIIAVGIVEERIQNTIIAYIIITLLFFYWVTIDELIRSIKESHN